MYILLSHLYASTIAVQFPTENINPISYIPRACVSNILFACAPNWVKASEDEAERLHSGRVEKIWRSSKMSRRVQDVPEDITHLQKSVTESVFRNA